jgi:hypothetical protein
MAPAIRSIALAAAALVLPLAARAQATPADSAGARPVNAVTSAAPTLVQATFRPLSAGDHVKVVSGAGRYTGTLTQVTADTLTLASPGRSDAVVLSQVSEMRRLVSRESRGKSIVRGAGLGLLAGAVLGYVGGTAAGGNGCAADSGSCGDGHDRTAQAAFTADGAIVGALLGAMLGPTFRRSRWERVTTTAAAHAALPPPAPTDSAAK